MSVSFARTDTSVLGRWWWTIDRWILVALGLLIGIGIILTFAASPPSAGRIGLDSYHFVKQQMFYVPMGVLIVLSVSLLSPRGIKRIAIPLFFIALLATALTLVAGAEIAVKLIDFLGEVLGNGTQLLVHRALQLVLGDGN